MQARQQENRDFPGVWWIGIRLPIQETRIRSLVQEEPTCCRATKPTHSYWSLCAQSPCSETEKPPQEAWAPQPETSPLSTQDPPQSKINNCVYLCMLSCFSQVSLFATLRTVAGQAQLSMGFSRPGYWNGWPGPPPGDLPNPGIEPASFMSPALADRFFTTNATWEAQINK